LQIPEDSGKHWLYQYCRYWKILENTGYTSIAELRSCGMYLYIVFFVLSASVMRGRTVYRETGRKENRGGRKEKRGTTNIIQKETKLCVIVFHKVAV
jgi:hypothetical protein